MAAIRWMVRRDMAETLQIEAASFTECWTEVDFLRVLMTRNCIGMVAEVQDGDSWRVVGFMIYEFGKTKLHVLNFAVHPGWRRRGVGRAMVEKMVTKLSDHHRTRITLDVRESNLAAQLFFKSCGMFATKVMRGFYDGDEDAYRMEYRIAVADSCPAPT